MKHYRSPEAFSTVDQDKNHKSPVEILKHFEYIHDPESARLILERVNKLIDHVTASHVDTLIFLDKSARPLAWVFRDEWKKRDNGQLPQIIFSNIGRERIGSQKESRDDTGNIVRTFYDEIRSHLQRASLNSPMEKTPAIAALFNKSAGRRQIKKWNSDELVESFSYDDEEEPEEPQESRHHVPLISREEAAYFLPNNGVPQEFVAKMQQTYDKNQFTDKSVLVVDEYGESGAAQVAAVNLFSAAFPTIKTIHSTYLYKGTEERQHIPWLQDPTLAGVIEILDVHQPFLTSRISQETLDKRRENLLKDLQHEWETFSKQEAMEIVEDLQEAVKQLRELGEHASIPDSFKNKIRQIIIDAEEIFRVNVNDFISLPLLQQKEWLDRLSETAKAIDALQEITTLQWLEKDDKNAMKKWLVAYKAKYNSEPDVPFLKQLNIKLVFVGKLTTHYTTRVQEIIALETLSPARAIEANKKLRSELKALSQFNETQKSKLRTRQKKNVQSRRRVT